MMLMRGNTAVKWLEGSSPQSRLLSESGCVAGAPNLQPRRSGIIHTQRDETRQGNIAALSTRAEVAVRRVSLGKAVERLAAAALSVLVHGLGVSVSRVHRISIAHRNAFRCAPFSRHQEPILAPEEVSDVCSAVRSGTLAHVACRRVSAPRGSPRVRRGGGETATPAGGRYIATLFGHFPAKFVCPPEVALRHQRRNVVVVIEAEILDSRPCCSLLHKWLLHKCLRGGWRRCVAGARNLQPCRK